MVAAEYKRWCACACAAVKQQTRRDTARSEKIEGTVLSGRG